jgi:hypothetical protein
VVLKLRGELRNFRYIVPGSTLPVKMKNLAQVSEFRLRE